MAKFTVSLAVCSVTMTAAALLFMLIMKPLKRVQSAKWRYYSWVLVFLGFLLPISPMSDSAAIQMNAHDYSLSVNVAHNSYMIDTGIAEVNFSRILQIAFFVWTAGLVLNLSAVLIRQMLFNRSIRRHSTAADERIKGFILEIADKLMLWADIRAVTVRGISSPMTVGFFKPTVIIPEGLFSDSELRLILEHELVHRKRRDLFIKAFMVLVASVHWFNPCIRLFVKRAERECELYCDETVMKDKNTEIKHLYCRAILNSASAAVKVKSGRAGAGLTSPVSSKFFSGKAGMKHRIKMILSEDKKRGLGLLCTAAAVTLTMYSGSVLGFSDYDSGWFGSGIVLETTAMASSLPVVVPERSASYSTAIYEVYE